MFTKSFFPLITAVAAFLAVAAHAQTAKASIREWDLPNATAFPPDPLAVPDGSLWYTGFSLTPCPDHTGRTTNTSSQPNSKAAQEEDVNAMSWAHFDCLTVDWTEFPNNEIRIFDAKQNREELK
jgi:hypothetical protein